MYRMGEKRISSAGAGKKLSVGQVGKLSDLRTPVRMTQLIGLYAARGSGIVMQRIGKQAIDTYRRFFKLLEDS
jgi:hypothetical protein